MLRVSSYRRSVLVDLASRILEVQRLIIDGSCQDGKKATDQYRRLSLKL